MCQRCKPRDCVRRTDERYIVRNGRDRVRSDRVELKRPATAGRDVRRVICTRRAAKPKWADARRTDLESRRCRERQQPCARRPPPRRHCCRSCLATEHRLVVETSGSNTGGNRRKRKNRRIIRAAIRNGPVIVEQRPAARLSPPDGRRLPTAIAAVSVSGRKPYTLRRNRNITTVCNVIVANRIIAESDCGMIHAQTE